MEVPLESVQVQMQNEPVSPRGDMQGNEQRGDEESSNVMNTIRDGIVSNATHSSYTSDIIHLLKWAFCNENEWVTHRKPPWFTVFGRSSFNEILTRRFNESSRLYQSRLIADMKTLLRDSFGNPIVRIDAKTPECYMDYVITL